MQHPVTLATQVPTVVTQDERLGLSVVMVIAQRLGGGAVAECRGHSEVCHYQRSSLPAALPLPWACRPDPATGQRRGLPHAPHLSHRGRPNSAIAGRGGGREGGREGKEGEGKESGGWEERRGKDL